MGLPGLLISPEEPLGPPPWCPGALLQGALGSDWEEVQSEGHVLGS